jgi:hypothetical protein
MDNLGVAVYPSIPVWTFIVRSFGRCLSSFRSRAGLQLEILALSHQLRVLQRSVKRPKLTPGGSTAMGLPMHRLERLAIQRRYRQSRDRHRLAGKAFVCSGPGRSDTVSRGGRPDEN